MLQKRNPKIDLAALGLLAVTVFLAASLLSYNPADPPSKLVCPERTTTANLCGRSGVWTCTLLLTAFGVGAYYLLVSLAVTDVVLLARRPIGAAVPPPGRLAPVAGRRDDPGRDGPAGLSPGPVIGSGGYSGAAMRGLLEMHFAATGAYIILVSLILGGLLLVYRLRAAAGACLDRRHAGQRARPRRGPRRHGLRRQAQPAQVGPRLRGRYGPTEGSAIPVTTRNPAQKPEAEENAG